MPIVRKWTISDKDGNPVEITSREVLRSVIAQMSPEEYERWRTNYRFAPIDFQGNFDVYYGTLRDLL